VLQGEPLYWGACLGLAVVCVELALDPLSRTVLHLSGDGHSIIRRVTIAIATTGLFVITRNLWLCLIVHAAVETLIAGWFPLPLQSPVQED